MAKINYNETLMFYINTLKKQGLIQKDDSTPRGLRVMHHQEERDDIVNVPVKFFPKPSKYSTT